MYKKITIIAVILIAIFVIAVLDTQSKVLYPSGRDTVESFGDGTFQILKGPDKNLSLVDVTKHGNLENEIINYIARDGNLYVHGIIGFTVVDWKTKVIKQYKVSTEYPGWLENRKEKYGDKYIVINNYKDFSAAEKKVFSEITNK